MLESAAAQNPVEFFPRKRFSRSFICWISGGGLNQRLAQY